MPANRFNGFTDYGVGIGLRIPHYQHIFERKPVVDWFEIISENYMVDGGRALHVLDEILEQYRVVQHGVSMYFGSAEPLNREHLRRLKQLVRRTQSPWLTDHLCWGSVDGRYTHDLLPMPYTFEAARLTAEKVRQVQDVVEVPVAVENVSSYAEFHVSEMTEWEFLNEVVEQADCGILLDVNNIYVSSRNHGFNPLEYVNSVPSERVAQIHIAGHSKFQKYTLDTHDHPVVEPVWQLYARAIERCGPTATLLEWDDNIPSFDEVHREALKANRFLRQSERFVKPPQLRSVDEMAMQEVTR
ncbi:MAG: MNIO family bufferin maturase [Acidobacteriaceae bacterium]